MNLLQPDYPLMLATLAAVLIPVAVLSWVVVRLLRRMRLPESLAAERAHERERLAEFAERLEEVADETRRLGEAQRFTTALLAGHGQSEAKERTPAV